MRSRRRVFRFSARHWRSYHGWERRVVTCRRRIGPCRSRSIQYSRQAFRTEITVLTALAENSWKHYLWVPTWGFLHSLHQCVNERHDVMAVTGDENSQSEITADFFKFTSVIIWYICLVSVAVAYPTSSWVVEKKATYPIRSWLQQSWPKIGTSMSLRGKLTP